MTDVKVKLEWNDNFCKICFDPLKISHFNCGHFIHLSCQIKTGSTRCIECTQEIRVTRWMERVMFQWQMYWRGEAAKPDFPQLAEDLELE